MSHLYTFICAVLVDVYLRYLCKGTLSEGRTFRSWVLTQIALLLCGVMSMRSGLKESWMARFEPFGYCFRSQIGPSRTFHLLKPYDSINVCYVSWHRHHKLELYSELVWCEERILGGGRGITLESDLSGRKRSRVMFWRDPRTTLEQVFILQKAREEEERFVEKGISTKNLNNWSPTTTPSGIEVLHVLYSEISVFSEIMALSRLLFSALQSLFDHSFIVRCITAVSWQLFIYA